LSYRLTKGDSSKITTEDLGGMPWRMACAAVNDQCAWYLGDHAFLPVNRLRSTFVGATPVNPLGLDRWATSIA